MRSSCLRPALAVAGWLLVALFKNPEVRLLGLMCVSVGAFSAMTPPVGMMMVVFPAFIRSRTSIQVSSSSHTDSRISIGRGVSKAGEPAFCARAEAVSANANKVT